MHGPFFVDPVTCPNWLLPHPYITYKSALTAKQWFLPHAICEIGGRLGTFIGISITGPYDSDIPNWPSIFSPIIYTSPLEFNNMIIKSPNLTSTIAELGSKPASKTVGTLNISDSYFPNTPQTCTLPLIRHPLFERPQNILSILSFLILDDDELIFELRFDVFRVVICLKSHTVEFSPFPNA